MGVTMMRHSVVNLSEYRDFFIGILVVLLVFMLLDFLIAFPVL